MPRRTPREDRKATHHRPGRNLSTRAKVARGLSYEGGATSIVRFVSSHHREHAAGETHADFVVCPKGKVGLTRIVAEQRLAAYSADRRPTRPVRIYLCPECSTPARPSWHLTSQPKR